MSGKKEIDLYQVSNCVKGKQGETLSFLRVPMAGLNVNGCIDRCRRFVVLNCFAEYQVQTQEDYHNQHEDFDSWCSSSPVKVFQVIFHDCDG